MVERKTVRCAIYTRVSTDAGLEQDFNSLDAQREAAEAYIKSQASEGWVLVQAAYNDGGFSGGNLDRPALKALLQAVRGRHVDVIVVYKVDRLTRSLADFAKLVELFDQNGTSFVSVTQSFNTTTSMGRLTLNVLLSFAQFEREVTAERIRDKIAASKKRGIWVGGNLPFGYRVDNRKLVIDPDEAEVVRGIYKRYLALGSLLPLLEELHQTGVRTRIRTLSSGKKVGGVSFTRGPLSLLLRNKMYIGELNHHGASYPGEHKAILDNKLFDAVQKRLTANMIDQRRKKQSTNALLQDLLFDDRGNRMSPTYAMKGGVRYRYYICRLLYDGRGKEAGKIRRISAPQVEQVVIDALRRLPGMPYLAAQAPGSATLPMNCEYNGQPHGTPSAAMIRSIISRVTVKEDRLVIALHDGSAQQRQIEVPWSHQRGHVRREIILPHNDPARDARPIRNETRSNLVYAVAAGRHWLDELITGRCRSVEELAVREARTPRSIQMHVSLAFLAPEILHSLIAGKLPRGIGVTKLINLPASWDKQLEVLGLSGLTGGNPAAAPVSRRTLAGRERAYSR